MNERFPTWVLALITILILSVANNHCEEMHIYKEVEVVHPSPVEEQSEMVAIRNSEFTLIKKTEREHRVCYEVVFRGKHLNQSAEDLACELCKINGRKTQILVLNPNNHEQVIHYEEREDNI